MIAIVVGHSQSAQGARAVSGITEWVFNLELGGQVVDRLRGVGRPAHLYLRHGGPYAPALAELTARLNADAPELVVSLHFNALDGRTSGTCALHWPGSTAGERLARELSARVAGELGLRDLGPRARTHSVSGLELHILGDTDAPAALLETHFGDHPVDHAAAREAVLEGRLAAAIVAGVLAFQGAVNVTPTEGRPHA